MCHMLVRQTLPGLLYICLLFVLHHPPRGTVAAHCVVRSKKTGAQGPHWPLCQLKPHQECEPESCLAVILLQQPTQDQKGMEMGKFQGHY